MKELRAIVEAHRAFTAEGKRSVLLTLVDVEGSSYRRPGARMLVDEDGRIAGFMGGGCLEGDMVEHARRVLESGHPQTISYDLFEAGELAWGLGVGCPGTIIVFLEPVDDELAVRLEQWARLDEPVALLTVFRTGDDSRIPPGQRCAVRIDGSMEGLPMDDPLVESVREEGLAVIDSRRSTVKSFGEEPAAIEALLEYLKPPYSLVVFGSGQDAAALLRLAAELNWEATVVDPGALDEGAPGYPDTATVLAADPEEAFQDLEIDERTAVVVMSHNYPRDRAVLDLLTSSSAPYIGLLGAASRRDALLSELSPENKQELQERLYSPMGLDIGGDRPEEIALAVAAEIQAVLVGRGGGFLRNRQRPIHDRLDEGDEAG